MSTEVTLRNTHACFPLEIEQVKEEHKAVAQSLIEAETLFEKLSSYYISEQDQEKLTEKLSSAYVELKKLSKDDSSIPEELASVAARIFYLYGLKLCGLDLNSDVEDSQTMLELAITCQLVAQKILRVPKLPLLMSSSLQELPRQLDKSNRTTFGTVAAYMGHYSDGLSGNVLSLDDKEAYNTTKMIRWLYAPYCPDVYKNDFNTIQRLFKEIAARTSEEIKVEATRSLCEIEYDILPSRARQVVLAELQEAKDGWTKKKQQAGAMLSSLTNPIVHLLAQAYEKNMQHREIHSCKEADKVEKNQQETKNNIHTGKRQRELSAHDLEFWLAPSLKRKKNESPEEEQQQLARIHNEIKLCDEELEKLEEREKDINNISRQRIAEDFRKWIPHLEEYGSLWAKQQLAQIYTTLYRNLGDIADREKAIALFETPGFDPFLKDTLEETINH
jgi:hypothetical protein